MRPPRPSRVNRRNTGNTLFRAWPKTIVVRSPTFRVFVAADALVAPEHGEGGRRL